MGRRTLVAVAGPEGRYDCRVAQWGVDADPIAQSRPLGTDWPAAAVLAAVDATYERLVVVDDSVRRYAVCWLDPTLSEFDDVVFARADNLDALRQWWVTCKETAARAIDGGRDPDAVRDDLRTSLQARAAAVYGPDDASLLFGAR